jgi:hypothetical protein
LLSLGLCDLAGESIPLGIEIYVLAGADVVLKSLISFPFFTGHANIFASLAKKSSLAFVAETEVEVEKCFFRLVALEALG